jgi:RNA methyltransferase, TrmH family
MKFDDAKRLHDKHYREEFGHFLLEGEHLVTELQKALANNPLLQTSELFITREFEHWRSPFVTHIVNSRQMAQLADTKSPPGIVAVVPIAAVSVDVVSGARKSNAAERSIYLHEIQDPGNLGTILRTLAWFGGFRCLLSPQSVDPYNGKAVRASMGAIFHIPVEIDVPLDTLGARFESIACLDMQGDSILTPAFRQGDCYVFGSEAHGVPRDALASFGARTFSIAGSAAIESLNLAAAVNICAYELSRTTDRGLTS